MGSEVLHLQDEVCLGQQWAGALVVTLPLPLSILGGLSDHTFTPGDVTS